MKLSELDADSHYPAHYPPRDFMMSGSAVVRSQADALARLVEQQKSETEVDKYLRSNSALLGACMNFTRFGHQGTWVISQQMVRPPLTATQAGMKPDYIIGGRSSEGFLWMVVELKGVDQPLFVQKGRRLALSSYANQGLCQLLEYVQYCNSAQSYLREQLRLTDFSNPKGLLLIGRQKEIDSDPRRQALRRQINAAFSGQIEIRSYDALVRSNHTSHVEE